MQIDVNGIKITLTDQQLKEIIEQQKKVKTKEELFEERFLDLISLININQPKIDFEVYPNTLFWFDKNGISYICEYNFLTSYFWISDNSWNIFKAEFEFNNDELRLILNKVVEKHFKLGDVITAGRAYPRYYRIEKCFKFK